MQTKGKVILGYLPYLKLFYLSIMKTTVELSKYPLNADYEPPILDFIGRLNAHSNITVKTNAIVL